MIVDRKWVERNIGFDPVKRPAPVSTFAVKTAASATATHEDLQREIIEFDSEATEGREFLAFTMATGLSRFTEIPWPKGMEPKTDKVARRGKSGALPTADVLVVTWTVDEGHALSRVLTPGKDSRDDYLPYTHHFAQISKKMRLGCPAQKSKRLGSYWTGKIGSKSVVYFKSESHMSQDGPQLPNIDVWTQIIKEVQPALVLTTGTGGGIGAQLEVGDVIVSPVVRFDCEKKFKNSCNKKLIEDVDFCFQDYSSEPAKRKSLAKAKTLFAANADQLPKENTRPPGIVVTKPGNASGAVLTTDFFGFDTSDNHFKLQGKGNVSDMGDAVLGLVAQQMEDDGLTAPRFIAVRNVSDPQIKAEGTLKQQGDIAANIYKAFGRWSSICSAIVCWALISAEQ